MTNTVSHVCGFADTTNTGVMPGTTLTDVPGSTTSGTGWTWNPRYQEIVVGDNGNVNAVRCTCTVDFEGTAGTLQNSDIASRNSTGLGAVILRHASKTTIAHNDIHGVGKSWSAGQSCSNGLRDIYSDSANLTFEYNNIWYCADPLNNITLSGLIKQNYAHDIATDTCGGASDCPHYEDIQTEDPGSAATLTIEDNTFLNQHIDQTAAIILSNDGGGTEHNRVINHNLLAGGGYTFYGSASTGANATNITFTNNRFSRIFAPNSGGYGPVTYWKTGGGNVWSGNIWDGTGTTVTP